jgi:hypothetical protein
MFPGGARSITKAPKHPHEGSGSPLEFSNALIDGKSDIAEAPQ